MLRLVANVQRDDGFAHIELSLCFNRYELVLNRVYLRHILNTNWRATEMVRLLVYTCTLCLSQDLDLIEHLFYRFVSINDLLDREVVLCLVKLLDGVLCVYVQLIEDSFVDVSKFRRIFLLNHLCK